MFKTFKTTKQKYCLNLATEIHTETIEGEVLTLGLLRGLEDRPVEAPLTERDLTNTAESNTCAQSSKKYSGSL